MDKWSYHNETLFQYISSRISNHLISSPDPPHPIWSPHVNQSHLILPFLRSPLISGYLVIYQLSLSYLIFISFVLSDLIWSYRMLSYLTRGPYAAYDTRADGASPSSQDEVPVGDGVYGYLCDWVDPLVSLFRTVSLPYYIYIYIYIYIYVCVCVSGFVNWEAMQYFFKSK